MKLLKKKALYILSSLLIVMSMSTVAFAGTVSTVNVVEDDGVVTVSGTASADTLACAVLVYDATGANLVNMETCEVEDNNTFSYTLTTKLEAGTYVIKIADYDGGAFKESQLVVSSNTDNGSIDNGNTDKGNTDSSTADTDNGNADNSNTDSSAPDTDNDSQEESVGTPTTGDNKPVVLFAVLALASGLGLIAGEKKHLSRV